MNSRIPRSRVTHDRWLVSYADFITLLFAFFVVLFAFARADQKKQMQVSRAIDHAFQSMGVFSASESEVESEAGRRPVLQSEIVSEGKVREDLEHMRRELEHSLAGQITAGSVALRMNRDGLVISLREAGFFPSGSATPRPESDGTLEQIAASLSHVPYDVRVEGHTDNVPIHTAEFDSNWELSSARATRIARTFLSLHAISSERLSAAGYAEFHPVATNGTAEGRAENRRVDLLVMPRSTTNLSGNPPATHVPGAWGKITDE